MVYEILMAFLPQAQEQAQAIEIDDEEEGGDDSAAAAAPTGTAARSAAAASAPAKAARRGRARGEPEMRGDTMMDVS